MDKKIKIKGNYLNLSEINLVKDPGLKGVKQFLSHYFNDETYFVAQTSGSTGIPKKMKLSKKYMKASAEKTIQFLDLKKGDKVLLCLSTEHIAGIMMLVRWIEGDLDLYIREPSLNPLEDLKEPFDFTAMVPLQISNSLEKLNQIGKVIIGGGAIPSILEEKLKKKTSRIYHTYGMTETLSHVALREIGEASFKSVINVKLDIDVRECLVIDAPDIGVNNMATNDVVELIGENEFVWKGRFDNVVNSGGIKLFPEEIEKEIGDVGVNYFLAGIMDEKLGEKLVMIVEGESNASIDSKISLLSKYKKPKFIYYTNEFEYTITQKIKRMETLKKVIH